MKTVYLFVFLAISASCVSSDACSIDLVKNAGEEIASFIVTSNCANITATFPPTWDSTNTTSLFHGYKNITLVLKAYGTDFGLISSRWNFTGFFSVQFWGFEINRMNSMNISNFDSVLFKDCRFTFMVGEILVTGGKKVDVDNCTFSTASRSFITAQNVDLLSITTSNFRDSIAMYGIKVSQTGLRISYSNLSNNTLSGPLVQKLDNFGIFEMNSTVFRTNTIISASDSVIHSMDELAVGNCTFMNNSPNGCINSPTLAQVTVEKSVFGFSSTGGNGACINSAGTVIASGNHFFFGTASLGGAICSRSISEQGNTFEHNVATTNGGAIYALISASHQSSTFYNNSASESGGSIYSNTISIGNSTFKHNLATNGGATYSGRPT
eukprot:TRINITY_DN3085_c0_g2_i1.p1 TRINITY_DN3085_c0_g2~~TRINITY_DN3085_c0_g2_i1.p1  ORF type:complete len:382 (+),score=45.02 TRINITY_DN3085_c0_g2_i1:219-1364(+)